MYINIFFSDFFFTCNAFYWKRKDCLWSKSQKVSFISAMVQLLSYSKGRHSFNKPLSWIRNGYQGTRGWGILHWLSSCLGGGSSNTPSSCVVWNPIWGLLSCGHWAPAIESTQVICALRALHNFLGNKGFFMIAPCIAISRKSCTKSFTNDQI